MIDLLDEITEIPFEVFWENYQEKKPGNYNRLKAEKEWFFMKESQRFVAFKGLGKVTDLSNEPWEYLNYFREFF